VRLQAAFEMAEFVMRGTRWTRAIIQFGKIGSAAAFLATPWLIDLPSVAAWNAWLGGLIVLGVVSAAFIVEARGSREILVALGLWNMIAPSILGFAGHVPATISHVLFGAAISMIAVVDISSRAITLKRQSLGGNAPIQFSEHRSGGHCPLVFRSEALEGQSAHGIRAKGGRHDGEAMEKGSNR
jgi:hypothetical protein